MVYGPRSGSNPESLGLSCNNLPKYLISSLSSSLLLLIEKIHQVASLQTSFYNKGSGRRGRCVADRQVRRQDLRLLGGVLGAPAQVELSRGAGQEEEGEEGREGRGQGQDLAVGSAQP